MKTEGRPQEIIAAAVERGKTVDEIFLSWLWQDFQALRAENERLRAALRACVAWHDDPSTKQAFMVAALHGVTCSEEECEEGMRVWAEARALAAAAEEPTT